MIPRRYVIAGLGILLAIVLAVILRPNGSDDANQAAEPVANVDTGESAEPEAGSEGETESGVEGEAARGGARKPRRRPRRRPRSPRSASRRSPRLEREASSAGESLATRRAAPGWVGSKVSELDLRRLGASGRRRSEGSVRLPPHHPVRRHGSVADHCPTPWIPLKISTDGGATWGPRAPLCHCYGRYLAVRPDHRGRAPDTAPSTQPF